jgi:E3 ubiquitin-protein ligase HERC2
MVQGLPVLASEEDCERWLSLELFSSGLETQSLRAQPSNNTPFPSEISSAKGSQWQDISRNFICAMLDTDFHDEKAGSFLFLVQRYCRQRNLYLPHVDQNPDHPIEKFGRLFMACLLKLHDLVPVVLGVLEQEGTPNNEQDLSSVQFPPSLADVCKTVYEAKVTLVKAHQESLCSYDEVCEEPIARCYFMIDHIRSPMVNVLNILHKSQNQVLKIMQPLPFPRSPSPPKKYGVL